MHQSAFSFAQKSKNLLCVSNKVYEKHSSMFPSLFCCSSEAFKKQPIPATLPNLKVSV